MDRLRRVRRRAARYLAAGRVPADRRRNGPSHVTDIWTVANTGAYGLTTTSAQAETLEALAALQPFH